MVGFLRNALYGAGALYGREVLGYRAKQRGCGYCSLGHSLGVVGPVLERKERIDDWIEEVKIKKFHRQRVHVRRGRLALQKLLLILKNLG